MGTLPNRFVHAVTSAAAVVSTVTLGIYCAPFHRSFTAMRAYPIFGVNTMKICNCENSDTFLQLHWLHKWAGQRARHSTSSILSRLICFGVPQLYVHYIGEPLDQSMVSRFQGNSSNSYRHTCARKEKSPRPVQLWRLNSMFPAKQRRSSS